MLLLIHRTARQLLTFALALILMVPAAMAQQWYPVKVDVWVPPFNIERKRVQRLYVPLDKAQKPWNICLSIPHLKDAYWLAVNYAAVDEARRLGVNLNIYQAGGYNRLELQRKQVKQCLQDGVDGLILSAISANGLNDLIKTAKEMGVPVVDLVNGIDSPDISARDAIDFYDAGYQTGLYLKKLNSDTKRKIRVAWFPGPQGAAWSAAGDEGFKAALEGSNIKIVASRMGDTGKTVQAGLIKEVLQQLGSNVADKLDYIVGTTVTAEAAVGIVRKRGLQDEVRIISYYYGPGVHKGIQRGTIVAAATDSQAVQARMAVDTMVRILEGHSYYRQAGPIVQMIDRERIQFWDETTTLAPRGFRPIFSVGNR